MKGSCAAAALLAVAVVVTTVVGNAEADGRHPTRGAPTGRSSASRKRSRRDEFVDSDYLSDYDEEEN